ncbi:hypothetical protein K7432_001142 [Basidiobolus ranarum]|uniref:Uncharacterized protein n=1 Tax=Basidiobolus ranarum TaxID=34480 RepID=A0ABR2X3J8_9FUNG
MTLETVQGVVIKVQASESYVYPSCSNCSAKLGTQPGYRGSPGFRRLTQNSYSPNVKKNSQNNVVTPIKTLDNVKALTPGPQMFCSRCHSDYLRECVSFKFRLSFVIAQAQEYKSVTVFGEDLDTIFGCNATDFRKFLRLISQKSKLDRLELKNALLESLESVMVGQLFTLKIFRTKSTKRTLLQNKRIPLSDKTSEYLSKLRLGKDNEDWKVRQIRPVYGLSNTVFFYLRERLNLSPDCLSQETDVYMFSSKNLLKMLDAKKYDDPWLKEPNQVKANSPPPQIQNTMNAEWEYGSLDESDYTVKHTLEQSHDGAIKNINLSPFAPHDTQNPCSFLSIPEYGDIDENLRKKMSNSQVFRMYTQGRNFDDMSPYVSHLLPNSSLPTHTSTPTRYDLLSASQASQFFDDFYDGTPNSQNMEPALSIADLTTPCQLKRFSNKSPIKPAEDVHEHPKQHVELQGDKSTHNFQITKKSTTLLVAETPENPKAEFRNWMYTTPTDIQTPTKSHSISSLRLAGCRWYPLLKYHESHGSVKGKSTIPAPDHTPNFHEVIPETPLKPKNSTNCMNSPLYIPDSVKRFVPETPAKEPYEMPNQEQSFWLDDDIIPPSDEED